jgi:hypothetical protein
MTAIGPAGGPRQSPAAPLPIEEAELPESYGATMVVLLAVNPYLVHALWDLAPGDLRQMAGPLGAKPRHIPGRLRFHDMTGGLPRGSFDVEVDLLARNWYVHLWSPGKTYYVELGAGTEGAGFIPLARSNVIDTPRAQPVDDAEEHFTCAGEPPRDSPATPGIPDGMMESVLPDTEPVPPQGGLTALSEREFRAGLSSLPPARPVSAEPAG